MRKDFTITKEQIKTLSDRSIQLSIIMTEWFPEAFKKEIEIGKWYVYPQCPKFITFIKEDFRRYGIGIHGAWFDNSDKINDANGYVEATQQEIQKYLNIEAVKRDLIHGNYAEFGTNKDVRKITSDQYFYDSNINVLLLGSDGIFDNGVWATLIETKTKSEAEKELNCKIID